MKVSKFALLAILAFQYFVCQSELICYAMALGIQLASDSAALISD